MSPSVDDWLHRGRIRISWHTCHGGAPRLAFQCCTAAVVTAHLSSHFLLERRRVAELADLLDAARRVVVVRPHHVVLRVRRADDVRPVKKSFI